MWITGTPASRARSSTERAAASVSSGRYGYSFGPMNMEFCRSIMTTAVAFDIVSISKKNVCSIPESSSCKSKGKGLMAGPLVLRQFAPHDASAMRQLVLAGLGDHFGIIDETMNPDLDDIT